MKLARLILPLLLACPALGQGLILGAPAQGSSSGGTALTGLGTDNRLARWDGTDTLQSSGVTVSDADLVDLSDTGGAIGLFFCVGTGQTTADIRLETNGGILTAREGDDSADAPMQALSLTVGAGSAAGPSLLVNDTNTGIYSGGTDIIGFSTAGTARWTMSASGHLLAGVDNTYDIGDAANFQPRNVYASSSVITAFVGLGSGSASAAILRVSSDANTGLFGVADTSISHTINGTEELRLTATGLELGPNLLLAGASLGSADASLARVAAGVWQGSDAAGTGAGQFRTRGATAIHSSLSPSTTEVGLSVYRDARAAIVLDSFNTTAGDGSYINLRRARGTAAAPGVLSSGDTIASILFQGTTEATPVNNSFAEIRATADGSVGPTDSPGRLSLFTTPDGSGTLTERLRIGQAGNTDLGTNQLVFGTAIGTSSTGLVQDAAGRLRVSDASTGTADLVTDDIILGAASTNGWRIDSNSATIVELNEGDGSEVDDGDLFRMANGTTTGRPAWIATDFSPSAPGHTFSGDTNTGYGSVEADAPAIAAEGQWRTIYSNNVVLPDNTATAFVTIPLASGARVQGKVEVFIDITDGTDHQSHSEEVYFTAVDKAGTLSSNIAEDATISAVVTAGTIDTSAASISDGTNAISLQYTLNSSLASPTITMRWILHMSHSTAGVAVTIP